VVFYKKYPGWQVFVFRLIPVKWDSREVFSLSLFCILPVFLPAQK